MVVSTGSTTAKESSTTVKDSSTTADSLIIVFFKEVVYDFNTFYKKV